MIKKSTSVNDYNQLLSFPPTESLTTRLDAMLFMSVMALMKPYQMLVKLSLIWYNKAGNRFDYWSENLNKVYTTVAKHVVKRLRGLVEL